MRVLFLYPYAPGSVASFVRPANIIKRLLDNGIEVTLAAVGHLNLAPTDINLSLREFSYLKRVPGVRLMAEKGAVFHNALIVNRLIKTHDLVHVQKCHPTASLPAVFASIMNHKPVHYDWDDNETEILKCATPPYKRPYSQIGEFALVERRLVRLVDTISVASMRLKTLALMYGAAPDRLFDAPVGADLSHFHPGKPEKKEIDALGVKPPMVLYQGQLEEFSFAEEFVQCAAMVRAEIPDAQFMVIGGGSKLENLRRLADDQGTHIDFTGYIPHQRVADYVRAADVCVATFPDNELTRCKSPLKIAEYLAAGKAIVASDMGDVRRMVSEAGLLVGPGDVRSLADNIIKLLREPGLRASLGEMARKRSEQEFNWERTTSNIVSAYDKALALRQTRRRSGRRLIP
ncbi:MAG: glycosyltransferase family 4 protein [Candidatus Coatesbacteria bacterium]|nr:glycosyltransferase family 4 protein [Candidatus Coatesbacteria bacterium]